MATMTAQFELNNPYAKYGLKRRPTFEEIVGLISDDKKALQPLPNREATRFRNSPQGSFFDGADAMELLKEQQGRILDRQMRDAILRRRTQDNNLTHHLERHRENGSSGNSVIEEFGTAPNTARAQGSGLDAETSMREQAELRRQEQVSQSFGQRLRDNASTLLSGLLPTRRPENIDISTPTSIDQQIAQAEGGFTLTPEAQAQAQAQATGVIEARITDEEREAIDDLPQNQKTVLFTNSFDFQKILTDNTITHEDLIFQLFFRNKYSNDIKSGMEEQPNDITKKIYLLGIIKGLIDDNEWGVEFNARSRKQKLAEWVRFKKSNIQQPSSSSSGIGGAIAEGAREGAKAVAKATVAKGGEMLVRRAFGV